MEATRRSAPGLDPRQTGSGPARIGRRVAASRGVYIYSGPARGLALSHSEAPSSAVCPDPARRPGTLRVPVVARVAAAVIAMLAGTSAVPAEAQVTAALQSNAWIFGALATLAAAVGGGLAIAVARRRASDARLRASSAKGRRASTPSCSRRWTRSSPSTRSSGSCCSTPRPNACSGSSASQAIGAPLERFLPERFRAVHRDHIARFGRTGETARRMGRQQALWALRADGSEFPIEASISHAAVAGHQLFTVILRDITERLATEARVREGEARLDAVVQSAMDAIITVNARSISCCSTRRRSGSSVPTRRRGRRAARSLHPERFRGAHRDHVRKFGETGSTVRRMGGRGALGVAGGRRGVPDRGVDLAHDRAAARALHRRAARHIHTRQCGGGDRALAPAAARALPADARSARRGADAHRARAARRARPVADGAEDGR